MLLHHTIKGAHYLIPFFGGGIDSEFIAAQLGLSTVTSWITVILKHPSKKLLYLNNHISNKLKCCVKVGLTIDKGTE